MTLHEVRLTDGVTSLDLAGSNSAGDAFRLHAGGFDLSYAPLVAATKPATVYRANPKPVAHSHGSRPVTLKPRLYGSTVDALLANEASLNAMLERALRYHERDASLVDNAPVYLYYRMAGSTKRNFLLVRKGSFAKPADWYTFYLTQGFVFNCSLYLETEPYVLEGRRTIFERHGSTASANGGIALGASDYCLAPGAMAISPVSGVISFWFFNNAAAATTQTILHEENGTVKVWCTGGVLTATFSVVTTGSISSTITLNAGTNWAVGWHHLAVSWGAWPQAGASTYQHGNQLYLDGVAAGGTTGNTNSLTALGRIFVGRKNDATLEKVPNGSAFDDWHWGRFWDGVFLTSAGDLASVGREADTTATCTKLDMQIKGDSGHENWTDVTGIRGDVPPRLEASVPVVTGGTGLNRIAVANRVAPGASFNHLLQAESFTLQTGVSSATGLGASGGDYVSSQQTPGTPSLVVHGTPGSTSYTYQVVAVVGGVDTAPSVGTTTASGPATLNVTDYIAVSWSAVSGASSYKVLRGGQVIATGIGTTSYNDTGAAGSSYSAAATTKAASKSLVGNDWNGRFRVWGRVQKTNGSNSTVQLKLTQTTSGFSKESAQVVLTTSSPAPSGQTTVSTNVWYWVDFGTFKLPIWATPGREQRATVQVNLWDTGTAANPVLWDCVLLLPYEDNSDLFIVEVSTALASYDRIHVEGEKVYRIAQYDFNAATGVPAGRFPSLTPGVTNRLIVSGSRVANNSSNDEATDYVFLYLDHWPQHLGFRS